MARRRVRVNPMQKAMGEDYIDDETIGNLAYLNQNDQTPDFNLRGTSNPEVSSQQNYQDVPRQMSDREGFQDDYDPQDLEGLNLLGEIAENEALEDSLDAVTETDPPQQYQEGIYAIPRDEQGNMIDPLEAIRNAVEREPELMGLLPEETRLKLSEQKDEVLESTQENDTVDLIQQSISQDPEILESFPEETRNILSNPESIQYNRLVSDSKEMAKPTEGAIEAGLNDPKVMSILERVDNLSSDQGYPEDIKQKAALWQEYYSKEISDISESAKQLGAKAKSGDLSTSEMIALGLATVVPALLALIYGKEAALGAISGGLQGASKYFEEKGKTASKASEDIKKLEKHKVDLMDKDIKFRQEFEKTITEPTVRKIVKERGYELLPEYETVGIKAIPEMGVYLRGDITESDAKQWEKEFPDDRKAFALQKEVDNSLSDIDDVMEVIREIDPSYYNTFLSKIKGYDTNGLLDAWGKTVPKVDMLVDGEIKKVNPLQQLSAMVNKFQTLYIKQSNLGDRLSENVKVHANEVIPNPSDPMSWLASDATDLQNKVKMLRSVLNRGFVKDASARGYVQAPLEAQYPYSQMQVYRGSDSIQPGLKEGLRTGKVSREDLLSTVTE